MLLVVCCLTLLSCCDVVACCCLLVWIVVFCLFALCCFLFVGAFELVSMHVVCLSCLVAVCSIIVC